MTAGACYELRMVDGNRASAVVVSLLLAVSSLAACGRDEREPGVSAATTTTTGSAPTAGTTPATEAPATAAPATAASTSTSEAAPAPGLAASFAFESSSEVIGGDTARRMSASWRPGCPVPLADLRLLSVTHIGFDGQPRAGELVVHAAVANDIVGVFRALFDARFPIEQMRLVDDFGGDDDQSMAANNTSAFNCRRATGSGRWSEHAYGKAIDINPVQNPYVTRSGSVLPPAGSAFVHRDPAVPGVIISDGPVAGAFDAIGWGWGGRWSGGKDYQHFSASGR